MIREILQSFHRLDAFLAKRLGRAYNALVGAGLVVELGKEIREIDRVGASASGIVGAAMAIILFAVLLIHQLGELHEHLRRRAESRPERGRGL